VKAHAGAPNVAIVLIDDVGFGHSSAFGGPLRVAHGLHSGRARFGETSWLPSFDRNPLAQ
jgi:arylsulfatase